MPDPNKSPNRENPVPAILYKVFVFGFGGLCVIYLIAPIVIALTMSFTSGQTLKYPPQGFSFKWYEALLDPVRSATEQIAAWNSLKIAGLAVLGSLLFAVPATIGMTRMKRSTVGTIEPLLLAPLVLPSLVYGLAALIVANFIGFRLSAFALADGDGPYRRFWAADVSRGIRRCPGSQSLACRSLDGDGGELVHDAAARDLAIADAGHSRWRVSGVHPITRQRLSLALSRRRPNDRASVAHVRADRGVARCPGGSNFRNSDRCDFGRTACCPARSGATSAGLTSARYMNLQGINS